MKSYRVKKIIKAKGEKEVDLRFMPWESADTIADFSYPWESGAAAPLDFFAMHDESRLLCAFRVTDDDIKVYRSKDAKKEVVYGDRVEIFFAKDPSLREYYCLEIDPYARVYDYRASYYRKFDDTFSWPAGNISVTSQRTEKGYDVYLALSISSLTDLGLIDRGKMRVGIFRGKCTAIDLENERMRWISWITPDSVQPDFHIPSSFGEFRME